MKSPVPVSQRVDVKLIHSDLRTRQERPLSLVGHTTSWFTTGSIVPPSRELPPKGTRPVSRPRVPELVGRQTGYPDERWVSWTSTVLPVEDSVLIFLEEEVFEDTRSVSFPSWVFPSSRVSKS